MRTGRMVKKSLAFLTVLMLALAIGACSSSKNKNNATDDDPQDIANETNNLTQSQVDASDAAVQGILGKSATAGGAYAAGIGFTSKAVGKTGQENL